MIIVNGQTAAIVNGTTTRANNTRVAYDRTGLMGGAGFTFSVTAGGAATGNLQLFIQDSFDGGATWHDLVATKVFTFGAAASVSTYNNYGSMTEGPGLLRTITGTNQGAGVELSETVPAGARWQFISLKTLFTADANVATRTTSLTFDDGANIFNVSGGNNGTTANASSVLTFATGQPNVSSQPTNALGYPVPTPMYLGSGYRIKTQTASKQVGDTYTATQYVVREWRGLDGPTAVTETFPAGLVRSGQIGPLLRVREVVSNIGGSPTGPTYSVFGMFM